MYYEQVIQLTIKTATLDEEVTESDIQDAINAEAYVYEVVETHLITPVAAVERIRELIHSKGIGHYRFANPVVEQEMVNFADELLASVINELQTIQERYEELV